MTGSNLAHAAQRRQVDPLERRFAGLLLDQQTPCRAVGRGEQDGEHVVGAVDGCRAPAPPSTGRLPVPERMVIASWRVLGCLGSSQPSCAAAGPAASRPRWRAARSGRAAEGPAACVRACRRSSAPVAALASERARHARACCAPRANAALQPRWCARFGGRSSGWWRRRWRAAVRSTSSTPSAGRCCSPRACARSRRTCSRCVLGVGMVVIMRLRDRLFPGTEGTGIPQAIVALKLGEGPAARVGALAAHPDRQGHPADARAVRRRHRRARGSVGARRRLRALSGEPRRQRSLPTMSSAA